MRMYCVKEKRETESIPGTEQIKTASNGRRMMISKCSTCGIMKTKFLTGSMQRGGAVPGEGFSCGYNLKGKRPGTVEERFKKGQIRRYGVELAEDLDDLIYDRNIDRKRAAAARRKPAVKKASVWTPKKQKEYVDEIVADIRGKPTVRTPKRPSPQLSRELLQAILKKRPQAIKVGPDLEFVENPSFKKVYNVNKKSTKERIRTFKTPRKDIEIETLQTLQPGPKYKKKIQKEWVKILRGVVLKKLIKNENERNHFGEVIIDRVGENKYKVKKIGETKVKKFGQGDTIRYLISLADDPEGDPLYEEILDDLVVGFTENNPDEARKIIGQAERRLEGKVVPSYQVGSNLIQYYRR